MRREKLRGGASCVVLLHGAKNLRARPWVVASLRRQKYAYPVRLLLRLPRVRQIVQKLAGRPKHCMEPSGIVQQQQQPPHGRAHHPGRNPLSRMPREIVRNLVSQHGRQAVLVHHVREEARVHEDVVPRQHEGVRLGASHDRIRVLRPGIDPLVGPSDGDGPRRTGYPCADPPDRGGGGVVLGKDVSRVGGEETETLRVADSPLVIGGGAEEATAAGERDSVR
mmetsp:Transcript_21952/g.34092  ORF Transcript_21952/g.34092 Transcript_21952/m.34092 type:complete len:223 (-) Transcript_21952:214-882(-)